MKEYFVMGSLVVSLFLTSCTGEFNRAESGTAMGALGGAVVGQAIGRNTGGTVIGALVGGAVGYMIGNEMDKQDQQRLNQVYEQGVSGQTSSWRNPDNGNAYSVTPEPAVTSQDGPCRKAKISSVIDGKPQTVYTNACRNSQGEWVLQ
ncbi:MAG: glycine zipper domain-containing protein [Desulfocapsaceae bacterium]|nr:glycine zipper domain-containing protein [Desulfocapsaceae bacterium]